MGTRNRHPRERIRTVFTAGTDVPGRRPERPETTVVPGWEMNPAQQRTLVRNDAQSLQGAEAGFRRFHEREPGEPVYPFMKNKTGIFQLPGVEWPERVALFGEAVRTLYESDKWHKRGDTVQYYHDHDPGKVNFCVPVGQEPDTRPIDLPFAWPDEVTLIGECIGFVVRPLAEGEITEGIMKGNNVLVASPDGWVDAHRPNRVFLAIINLDGGGIESIITGGNLRITPHGIEG